MHCVLKVCLIAARAQVIPVIRPLPCTYSPLQARHCESVKADSIACITPSYFKPQTVEDLVEYMRLVAAEAPNTPFYLYDINFMTNVYCELMTECYSSR